MSALDLSGVTVRRGPRTVLDRATVTFAPGQLTAVLGANGAGKSTLLAAAAGLLPIAEGTIMLAGEALASVPRAALARRRAYLPQGARVDWPISVERVVALGLAARLPLSGRLPAPLSAAVDRAIAACDLEALRARPATSLSGGELARALLARAIVGEPELIIADEPTAGLDPRHALDAMARLRALARGGRTVVVASHDLALAARFADAVVGLSDGRVALAGPTEQALSAAALQALFGVEMRIETDAAGVSVRWMS